MLKFKFRIEHFIILVLAVLLLLDGCRHEKPVTTVERTVEDRIITEIDSSCNNEIKNRKPEKVKILETEDSIQPISENEIDSLSPEDQSRVKAVNHYQDTTYFENAVIYSDIFSEGRILKYDLKTSISHLERTIHEKQETTRQAGGLFLSPTAAYFPGYGIATAGAGLTLIKGNFGFSAGAFYDFRMNHIAFQITFHKRIL
ncbi:MAG: hypothetical protein WBL21_00020 [Salinimicrobium sp.]